MKKYTMSSNEFFFVFSDVNVAAVLLPFNTSNHTEMLPNDLIVTHIDNKMLNSILDQINNDMNEAAPKD